MKIDELQTMQEENSKKIQEFRLYNEIMRHDLMVVSETGKKVLMKEIAANVASMERIQNQQKRIGQFIQDIKDGQIDSVEFLELLV